MYFSNLILPLTLLATSALATDKVSKPHLPRGSWRESISNSKFMEKVGFVKLAIPKDHVEDVEHPLHSSGRGPYLKENTFTNEFLNAMDIKKERCAQTGNQCNDKGVEVAALDKSLYSYDQGGEPMRVVEKVMEDGSKKIYLTHDVDMKKSYYQEINAMLDKFYASIKDEDFTYNLRNNIQEEI